MRKFTAYIFILQLMVYTCHSMAVKKLNKRNCGDGNCNDCDNDSCNNCNDNNCSNCENTSNCNSCNNNCCSSASCTNNCIVQCKRTCSTNACNNNCRRECDNTCQQSRCSSNNKCSSGGCSNKQCSTGDCNTHNQSREKISDGGSIILTPSESSQLLVNNTNNNIVNLTTIVNIDNVVHNYNNISIPIFVNTTNINNINVASDVRDEHSGSNGQLPIVIQPERQTSQCNTCNPIYPIPPWPVINTDRPSTPKPSDHKPCSTCGPSWPITQGGTDETIETLPNNCCHVIHPKQCYTAADGSQNCQFRRTFECSNQCTAPVVTIEHERQSRRNCQITKNWPYLYCGNYIKKDCNQCYSCGEDSATGGCFQGSGCSETCRQAAPRCLQTLTGQQCY